MFGFQLEYLCIFGPFDLLTSFLLVINMNVRPLSTLSFFQEIALAEQ